MFSIISNWRWIKWAIGNWQMLLLAVVMVFGLVIGVYAKGWTDATDHHNAKQEKAQAKAEKEAREKIRVIENEHDKIVRDILRQVDNGILCPISSDTIKRLYNPDN